jgi:uncharacterized hydrophobic protein (TIGR00271 family)
MTDVDDLEELDEAEDRPLDQFEWLDLKQLFHPFVLKALIGIVLGTLVLVSPQRADRLLSYTVAVALLAISIPVLWTCIRDRRDLLSASGAIAGMGVAVVLLLSGARSQATLAQLVGAVAVGLGIRSLVLALRGRVPGRSWAACRGAAMVILGALTIMFPDEMFAIVTILVALDWIAIGVVAVAVSIDRRSPRLDSFDETTDLIRTWIDNRPSTADDRTALYDNILYEGGQQRQRIMRFFALTGLAAVISAMGIITDSTAVVIGAMLISPLMGPLMGMSLSLTMGWPTRLLRSTALVLVGITISIVLALLLSVLAPATIDVVANGQIASRSAPTLLDLIIAVAAGTAGAYGLSRPDVSDALPGVAVAIALLPPLSVVGIAYSQQDWGVGNGALLLFATNAVAILIMGGVTFVYTGVVPLRRVAVDGQRTRTWIAALVAIIGLILGGLLLNDAEVAQTSLEEADIERQAIEWLEDHDDHELLDITIDHDAVEVTIAGPTDEAPTATDLAEQLRDALGRDVTIELRHFIQQRSRVTAEE